MLELGRSGAKILELGQCVVKYAGGANLRLQGRLAMHLGERVCPEIYGVCEEAYLMERLNPWVPTMTSIPARLYQTKVLLEQEVWNRQPLAVWKHWREHVGFTCTEKAPWIKPSILYSLYPNVNDVEYCLTHGDPTLANVMIDDMNRVRLIDPIPARLDVPPLRELDLGKLLQSAAGWEHVICDRFPELNGELNVVILSGCDSLTARRAAFWASYHCARILHHEEALSPAAVWAADMGREFYKAAE